MARKPNILSEQEQGDVGYVLNAMRELTRTGGQSVTSIARISGYERSAFHRLLDGNAMPKLLALIKLSRHFGRPISCWFPSDLREEDPSRWSIISDRDGCLMSEADPYWAPLTKRIVAAVAGLSAKGKKDLLAVAERMAMDTDDTVPTESDSLIRRLAGLTDDQRAAVSAVVSDHQKMALLESLAKADLDELSQQAAAKDAAE